MARAAAITLLLCPRSGLKLPDLKGDRRTHQELRDPERLAFESGEVSGAGHQS